MDGGPGGSGSPTKTQTIDSDTLKGKRELTGTTAERARKPRQRKHNQSDSGERLGGGSTIEEIVWTMHWQYSRIQVQVGHLIWEILPERL